MIVNVVQDMGSNIASSKHPPIIILKVRAFFYKILKLAVEPLYMSDLIYSSCFKKKAFFGGNRQNEMF